MDALLNASEVLTNTAPVNVLSHDTQPWRVASPKDQTLLSNLSADCLTPLTFLGEGAYGCVELCRVSVPILVTNGPLLPPEENEQHEQPCKKATGPCPDSAYSLHGGSDSNTDTGTAPHSRASPIQQKHVQPGLPSSGAVRLSPLDPKLLPPRSPFACGRAPTSADGGVPQTASSVGPAVPGFPYKLSPRSSSPLPPASPASPAAAATGLASRALPPLAVRPSNAISPAPLSGPSSGISRCSTPTASASTVLSNELVVAVKRLEYQGGGRAAGADKDAAAGGTPAAGGCPKARRNAPSHTRLSRMQAIELLQLSRCRECPFIVRVFGCVPDGPAAGGGAGQRSSAPAPPSASCRIVMEWAEGGDLGSLLQTLASRREPSIDRSRERLLMSEGSARYYMGCLLEALSFLHGRGLIHRDVKPANLLLSSDGRAKLGDLGMVCHVDKEGLAVGRAGTPNYMAPEVWAYGTEPKYARGYGVTADLWSAGVLLHELLTGRLPASHPDAYLRRNWCFTPRCAALSPALCDLLSRLLSVKRRRRPQSCAEVAAHPWFAGFDWQALRGGTMQAPYVPAAHRPPASSATDAAGAVPRVPHSPGGFRSSASASSLGLVPEHMAPVMEGCVGGSAAGAGAARGGSAARPSALLVGTSPRVSGAGGPVRHSAPPAMPPACFQPRLPSPGATPGPALQRSVTPRLGVHGSPPLLGKARLAASLGAGPFNAASTASSLNSSAAGAVGRSAPAWDFGLRVLGRALTMAGASSLLASPGAASVSDRGSFSASGSTAAAPAGAGAGAGGAFGAGLASMAAALVSAASALVPQSRTNSGDLRSSVGFAGCSSSGMGAGHTPSRLSQSTDVHTQADCPSSAAHGGVDAEPSVRSSAPLALSVASSSPGGVGSAAGGVANRTGSGRPPRPSSQGRPDCASPAPLESQRTVSYSFLLSPPAASPSASPRDSASTAATADPKHRSGAEADCPSADCKEPAAGDAADLATPPNPVEAVATHHKQITLMSLPQRALALGSVCRRSGSWMQQQVSGAAAYAMAMSGQLQAAAVAAAAALAGGSNNTQGSVASTAAAPAVSAGSHPSGASSSGVSGQSANPGCKPTEASVKASPVALWSAPDRKDSPPNGEKEPATGVVLVRRTCTSSDHCATDNVNAKFTAPISGGTPTQMCGGGLLPPRPARHSHRYTSSFAFDLSASTPPSGLKQTPSPRTPSPRPASTGEEPDSGGFTFTVLPIAAEEDGSPALLAGTGTGLRLRMGKPGSGSAGSRKIRTAQQRQVARGARHDAAAMLYDAHGGCGIGRGRGASHVETGAGPQDSAVSREEAMIRLYAAFIALVMAILVALRFA